MDLKGLETEARNASTMDIDGCSTLEIVEKINAEDRKVADVVASQKEAIAKIIDEASSRMVNGLMRICVSLRILRYRTTDLLR